MKRNPSRSICLKPLQWNLVEEIRALDVMSMTPIEALNTLFTLKEKARKA